MPRASVDQEGDLLVFVGPRLAASTAFRHKPLDVQRRQPDEVEAEAGIERIGERVQPCVEQFGNGFRLAQWSRGFKRAMRRTMPSVRGRS